MVGLLTRRSCLDALEDRRTPAVIAWDGGPTGDGTDFLTATNWVGDVLPAATDDVTIGSTGSNPAIVLSANRTVNSLTSSRVLQIRGNSTVGNVALTATAGIMNTGTLELTSSANFAANVTVNGGALTNAAGATFRASPGSGGARTVFLANGGIDFVNLGTLAVDANLNVSQAGGGTSFDTSGGITIAAGRTFSPGAQVNYLGGSVGGGGTLNLTNSTVNLTGGLTVDGGFDITYQNTTVNGPGTLTVAAGATLTAMGGTVNAPFANAGTFVVRANTTLAGSATSAATATYRVQGNATAGNSTLTLGTGLTNAGLIELTSDANFSANLSVTGGTLTNAPTGTLRALPGSGGNRTVQLSNTIDFVNQGTVTADTNLSVTTGGGGSSFDSSGPIGIATTRTLSAGATFNYQGGAITGGGTLSLLNTTASLATGLTLDGSFGVTFQGTTVNGPGALTVGPGATLTAAGGTVNAPFANNGTLVVRTNTQFNSGFTVLPTSVTRVLGNATSGNVTLTTSTGLANTGLIELTSDASFTAALSVTGGTLTNAATGTLRTLPGSGGNRTVSLGLAVDFVNQGAVAADANFTVVSGGSNSSLDSSGPITVAAGRTFTPGALFNYQGGTLSGGGTISLVNATAGLAAGLTLDGAVGVTFQGTTVNGPATLTVAPGVTVTYAGGTVNAPFVNNGTLLVRANTTLAGGVTVSAASTIRVVGNATAGGVFLTLADGLTNIGLLELTSDANFATTLTVTGGMLTNGPTGTLRTSFGSGGNRSVLMGTNVDFVNQGLLAADTDTTVSAGAGTGDTFNTGTFSVASGRTLTLTGTFTNFSASTLTGGTYDVAGTFRFTNAAINALAADLRLTGAASAVLNNATSSNALANLGNTTAAGRLALASGRNFTGAAAFTNGGTLAVGAGCTFTATTGLTSIGTLSGAGTVAANLSGSGTVTPGDSPGLLTVAGNVALNGVLAVELNGATAGTEYDQLAVNGPVTIGGSLNLNLNLGFVAPGGTVFRVIDNDGTDVVNGTFATLPEGGVFTLGGQTFRITYAGGTGNDVVLTRVPSPKVSGVAINVGQANSTQRSKVTSVTITFDSVVTFAGNLVDAFSLSRIGGGSVGGFNASANVVGGVSVVTLSGFTGAETQFGSLADGRYTVLVRANQVSAGGAALDGDNNGLGGDDFAMAGSVANGLYRLFGDVNADGTVNAADFGQFRPTFGTAVGNPLYLEFLDVNGDGFINAFDFAQFRTRFGSSVP